MVMVMVVVMVIEVPAATDPIQNHLIDVICARVELILLCYKNLAMNMYMTFLLIAGCYVLMLSYPLGKRT